MLEYIPISIALAGSSLAGLWDLKTTEIPDSIPHMMAILGLVFWGIQSYFLNDYWLIAQSMIAGLSLLGLGAIMYYFGQWGGGDAKILSAIGFLVPYNLYSFSSTILPFPVSYLINVFLLGAIYMIVYALVLALKNREIFHDFFSNVKASAKTTAGVFAGIIIIMILLAYFLGSRFGVTPDITQTFAIPFLYVFMIMLWRFVLSVEKVGFRKKVSVDDIKVGDVLLDSKYWEGMTQKDIDKIKKSGKESVVIKDGVRFGPVFPIALLFTLLVGDSIMLFFSFI